MNPITLPPDMLPAQRTNNSLKDLVCGCMLLAAFMHRQGYGQRHIVTLSRNNSLAMTQMLEQVYQHLGRRPHTSPLQYIVAGCSGDDKYITAIINYEGGHAQSVAFQRSNFDWQECWSQYLRTTREGLDGLPTLLKSMNQCTIKLIVNK